MVSVWRRWRTSAAARVVAVALILPLGAAVAVEGPLETVAFGSGDTIRGVAERYLKDPDLWPQILELSGIASSADLRPGTELKVPVRQVAAADEALAFSLLAIQRATAEGARIFAPAEIGEAIESRDTAVERRGAGSWAEVVTYAGIAVGHADRAYEISLAQRDRAAEAVVSDAHGAVEGRGPDEASWTQRAVQDILVEFERLRTLSASTAQVTFRDLSRLRLNPNSNATIQRMRSDPLTGGEVTKVSLVSGDFYALLNQLGDRSTFEVEVPGVETETQSSDFWVKHDGAEARFANYDSAALRITRGAEAITLGENEGAVVPRSGEVERTEVLARAELDAPFDGAVVYDPAVALSWRPMDGAEAYWVEVAADAGFNVMQSSEWGVRATRHVVEGLEPGVHFWRVSSLDRLGLPGVRSLDRRFRMVRDDVPPFIALSTPAEGEIVTGPEVALAGESEPGVRLTVNGGYVPVGDNGRFATVVQATPGANAVVVAAVDPAGNRTERSRGFVFRPGGAAAVSLDPSLPRDGEGRLLSRTGAIDVAGRAAAGAGSRVGVLDAGGATVVQTTVAEDGGFRVSVPATPAGVAYRIEVLAPDGTVEGTAEFGVRQDAEAPRITFDPVPPASTANPWVELTGGADDAVEVTVAGVAARLADGRFDASASLEPGPNTIEVVARDVAGNLAVLQVEVVHDAEPPEILSATASRPQGAGGPIELVVEARDASGLRQPAPFVLMVGGVERRGFLRCDSGSGTCRATLPPEAGSLALVEVAVEDYAGNVARE